MAELTWRLDLGSRAHLDDVSEFVGNVGTVCHFGSALQRIVNRNDALYQVISGRSEFYLEAQEEYLSFRRWRSGPPWVVLPGPQLASAALERAVARQLFTSEVEGRAEVRVERLTYENPLELVIVATGAAILGILRLVRDWPANRRLADARARDFESRARTSDELRQVVVQQVAAGQLRLTPEQVLPLLTFDVEQALRALAEAPLSIEGLDDEESIG